MKTKYFSLIIPLLIFGVVVFFLWMGLHRNPRLIPSPLINKKVPSFSAESLFNSEKMLTEQDLKGKISLVNVFATWCIACHAEHPVWMEVKRDLPEVQFIGLNYKDNREEVKKWLSDFGNPYGKILFDPHGEIGINFGVYGTPETFIIDKQGFIRYKYIGAVSPSVWNRILLPEIRKWEKAPS